MGNGVGPYWFPKPLRVTLTRFSLLFFDEASWDKHDEGYRNKSHSRWTCDLKFLQAMKRDASKKDKIWRMLGCDILSWLFWLIVRTCGRISWNRTN